MVAYKKLLLPYLLAAPLPAAAGDIAGPVSATVERVVDGDTVRVSAQIWVDQLVLVSVRLRDVDAPELFRPQCPAEKERAREAKAYVEAMLGAGEVSLSDVAHDKYGGRVVARLVTASGEDVGAALLAEGLAVATGDADPWCG